MTPFGLSGSLESRGGTVRPEHPMTLKHCFSVVCFILVLFFSFLFLFFLHVLNSSCLTPQRVPCPTMLQTACDPGGGHGPVEPEAPCHMVAQHLSAGAFPDTLASSLFHMDTTDESGISLHRSHAIYSSHLTGWQEG